MKKVCFILVLSILFSLFIVGALSATPVTVRVLDSHFHIEGEYWGVIIIGYTPEGDPIYDDVRDNYTADSVKVPLDGRVEYDPAIYASSRSDFFSAEARAEAHYEPDPYMFHADALAEMEAVFMPCFDVPDIIFNYRYSTWSTLEGRLEDLTDGIEIWSLSIEGPAVPPRPDLWNEEVVTHNFRADHTYRLYFQTYIGANEDFGGSYLNTTDLIPVPEPATMLLFCSLLIGFLGTKRKYTN